MRCAGHDWGGTVAADFAAMFPDRVSKLVLAGAVPSVQLQRSMDVVQLGALLFQWQLLVPWLPERVLPLRDFALVRGCFCGPQFGLMRTAMPAHVLDCHLDALAQPGALPGALKAFRCAASAAHGWCGTAAHGWCAASAAHARAGGACNACKA
jgi:epoxide hydrolase 4